MSDLVYADCEFYKHEYYGTAIQEEFPRYAQKASVFLDYCTLGRAKAHPELWELKMACCALADQYKTIELCQQAAQNSLQTAVSADGAEVSSESVGSWSKSFRSAGESAAGIANATKDARAELFETARIYLANTGLMSARGFMV